MNVRIKICGVRSLADVEACVRAGVDMVGFNFWPGSQRYIPPGEATALVKALPPSILPVGVFVQAAPQALFAACRVSGVTLAQLHGDEDPALYVGSPVALMQVIRVPADATAASLRAPRTPIALLDSRVKEFGGQGQPFHWALAAEAHRLWQTPVIIAGGLHPQNVRGAILMARPFGVDVASGVESSPGVKDADKVMEFVAEVRAAEIEGDRHG